MRHAIAGVGATHRIGPTSRLAGPLVGVVQAGGDDEAHLSAVLSATGGKGFPALLLPPVYRVRV